MEDKYTVRITRNVIRNLKNVCYGEVPYMNYGSVNREGILAEKDIVGIYGQNGSGKTALIEALDILRYILQGKAVPFDMYAGILDENEPAWLETDFYVQKGDDRYKVHYLVCLRKNDEQKSIQLIAEELTYWRRGNVWKAKRSLTFRNPYYEKPDLLENQTLQINSDQINKLSEITFLTNMHSLALVSAQKYTSVFFNLLVRTNLFKIEGSEEVKAFKDVIFGIMQFGLVNMCVVKVNQLGTINNNKWIPMNVHRETESSLMQGILPLYIEELRETSEEVFARVQESIDAINIVMRAIVPGLQIELVKKAELEHEDGKKTIQIETYSNRNGKRFLVRYESEGIKRIISVLNCLIAAYNDPGVCLIVDELDSGIFEYLLGELLGLMHTEMKGQLIFTSHNLRVLEKLDDRNIVCSTVNPDNRYIRLTGISRNHNKRDFYIRAITVGGQKEKLYDDEDLLAMGYAFRKAGKVLMSQAEKTDPLRQEKMPDNRN